MIFTRIAPKKTSVVHQNLAKKIKKTSVELFILLVTKVNIFVLRKKHHLVFCFYLKKKIKIELVSFLT